MVPRLSIISMSRVPDRHDSTAMGSVGMAMLMIVGVLVRALKIGVSMIMRDVITVDVPV